MVALEQGRISEAPALMSEAFPLGERAQPDMAIPAYGMQQFMLAELEGHVAEVEETLRGVVADFPARVAFRCALAYLLARLDRHEEASSLLTDLVRDDVALLPFDQEWLYGMCLLAETAVILDDSTAAAGLYRCWSRGRSSSPSITRKVHEVRSPVTSVCSQPRSNAPTRRRTGSRPRSLSTNGSRHGRGRLPLR